MDYTIIDNVIRNWSSKSFDGKSFDAQVKIDGIPVWWFLQPLILSKYFPRPFRYIQDLEEELPTSGIKNRTKMYLIKKSIVFNDSLKRKLSSKKDILDKHDVLFISYLNKLLNGKDPLQNSIIENVKNMGLKPFVVYCDSFSGSDYMKIVEAENTIYRFFDQEIVKEAEIESTRVSSLWTLLDKKKFFTYSKLNYYEFMKNELDFLFSKDILYNIFLYYYVFKKIIQKNNIKLCFLTGLGSIPETCLLAATVKNNKKTLYSPHGYGSRMLDIPLGLARNMYFAAYGKENMDSFVNSGISPKRIYITGPIFFDKISMKKPSKVSGIVLMTQPMVEDGEINKSKYYDCIEWILGEVKGTDLDVFVKPHPRERNINIYKDIARKNGIDIELVSTPSKKDLYTFINRSKIIVSLGSTIDVEAILLDKDVIVVEGLKKGYFGSLVRKDPYKKAVFTIENGQDLRKTILSILNNKKVRDVMSRNREIYVKNTFSIDGNASKRIANLISKLVK